MSRKLGTAINNNYDNNSLALTSRLAAANSGDDDFFSGDINKLFDLYGKYAFHGSVTELDALKAISTTGLGYVGCYVQDIDDLYFYRPLSSAAADDFNIVLPNSNVGRWYRAKSIGSPVQTVSTPGNLPSPLPRMLFINVTGEYRFAPILIDNGFQYGDQLWIYNTSTDRVALKYSDDTSVAADMEPGQIFVLVVQSIGTPGVLQLFKTFGNLSTQQADAVAITGGTLDNIAITNSSGVFKTLKQKIGSFFASFTNSLSGDRTYTFPDQSGTVALTSDLNAYQPLASNLTQLAALNPAFSAGFLYLTPQGTFTSSTTTQVSLTSYNNLTNAVLPGDSLDFTSASAKTFTLDVNFVTGLGYPYYFTVFNSGAGELTFTSSQPIHGANVMPAGGAAVPKSTVSLNYVAGAYSWSLTPENTSVNNTLTVSGTTLTLTASYNNALINCTNAGTTTITVPTNASNPIPIGSQFNFVCTGGSAALMQVSLAGGVTLNFNTNIIVGDKGQFGLVKIGTDTWTTIMLYEEYTHTTTWGGIFSPAQSGNPILTRNMRSVSMVVPLIQTTTSASAQMTMTTAFPARFRPSANVELLPVVADAGNNWVGNGTLTTAGALALTSRNYTNFTNAAVCGSDRCILKWDLA